MTISDTAPSVPLLGVSFLQKLALKNEILQREYLYVNHNPHRSLQINGEPPWTPL